MPDVNRLFPIGNICTLRGSNCGAISRSGTPLRSVRAAFGARAVRGAVRRSDEEKAGDRGRTGDLQLGRLTLCQLSYAREAIESGDGPGAGGKLPHQDAIEGGWL